MANHKMARSLFKSTRTSIYLQPLILFLIFPFVFLISNDVMAEFDTLGNFTGVAKSVHELEPLFAVSDMERGKMITAVCSALCQLKISEACMDNCDRNAREHPSLRFDDFISTPSILCCSDARITTNWTSNFLAQINDLIYLVELFQENLTDNDDPLSSVNNRSAIFIAYTVTDLHFATFYNLSENTKYFIRVTSFAPTGHHTEPVVSKELWTLHSNFVPAVVPLIWQGDIKSVKNSKLETVIMWKPAYESSCFYDVVAFVNGAMFMEMEKRIPNENFSAVLTDMDYDTNFTVSITATTADRRKEAEKAWFSFKTDTCMETHNDSKICKPPEPTGLIATEDFSLENDGLYEVTISWNKPELSPDYYNINLTNADTRDYKDSRNISGNKYTVKFDKANIGSLYQVTVSAGSQAGLSNPAYLYREVKPPISGTRITGTLLWSVLAPIISIIIIIATVAFIYHRHKKLKLYKRRCRYFEELEQKAPKEADSGSSFTINPEDDGFEVIPEKLILYEVLGEGAFGVVRKGWLQDQRREVAVKMLKDEPSAEEVKQFRQEIDMMKSVGGHAHIVSLVGCCTRPSATMMLVVEFCARGDLQNYLRLAWDELTSNTRGKPLTPSDMNLNNSNDNSMEQIRYAELLSSENSDCETSMILSQPNLIVNRLYDLQQDIIEKVEDSKDNEISAIDLLSFGRQISMGMEFLSCNRVVHRDLAARNVLVCADKTIKIADFGLSRDIYQENMYRKTGTGKLPIKWMALESLTHQVYTTQSDVWSFGILLWEIVTLGGNPYPSVPTGHLLKLLMSGYRMERPNNCSEDLYALMMACWRTRPKDRPTFGEIRLRLDNLLDGMCSHAYLSLDVFDHNEIDNMRKISSDQISKGSGYSHHNSGSMSRDCERYVRPISLGKGKTSVVSAQQNHYSFQPPSIIGSYPSSQTSIRMQDEDIESLKVQNFLTAQYPPIINDETVMMTKLSYMDNDLISPCSIINGDVSLSSAYSTKAMCKSVQLPPNTYTLKHFSGH